MEPSRLAELQRQRDLVREHLAWLDREIAAALTPPRGEMPPSSRDAARTSETAVAPAALSSQPDPASAAASARRGCFIFAALAAVLFAGILAGIYVVKYRDRPLLFAEPPGEAGTAR